MIKLANREKRMQVFNLPKPEDAPKDEFPGQSTTLLLQTELEDGMRGKRIIEKHINDSLTILAGETVENLPDWVASCPEVKAALDRGALKLIKQ